MGKKPGSARYGAYAYAIANEYLSGDSEITPEIAKFYQNQETITYYNRVTGQYEEYPNPYYKPHVQSPAPFGGAAALLLALGIGSAAVLAYLQEKEEGA